jgi:hypothetical protein
MKDKITRIVMIMIILLSITSCSIIKGIFNVGIGVGIFIMIAIVAIVIFVITKILGQK